MGTALQKKKENPFNSPTHKHRRLINIAYECSRNINSNKIDSFTDFRFDTRRVKATRNITEKDKEEESSPSQ